MTQENATVDLRESSIPAEVTSQPQRPDVSRIERRRAALIGHTCSPLLGSEPGNVWNWATQLSLFHEITVFCHPVFRPQIEAELSERPRSNLRFVWVNLESWDPWNPARGERGVRLHYYLWQRKALAEVRRELKTTPFDLVHHVAWGSLLQPPCAWRSGIPFVWGPVGGGQVWPPAFLNYVTRKKFERFRSAVVRLGSWNPQLRATVRHAAHIFATNPETEAELRRLGAKRIEVLTDTGVNSKWLRQVQRQTVPGALTLLIAGRLEARKGVGLALEALARVKLPNVRLVIAGHGPLLEPLREQASSLGIGSRVDFLGLVPWQKMSDVLDRADVLCYPSLRDSSGAVVMEAMSCGLPVLMLNHQGVAVMVADDAAVKVPVTTPEQVVAALAAGMEQLANDVSARVRMSAAAYECAVGHTWEQRGAKMANSYEEILRAQRA